MAAPATICCQKPKVPDQLAKENKLPPLGGPGELSPAWAMAPTLYMGGGAPPASRPPGVLRHPVLGLPQGQLPGSGEAAQPHCAQIQLQASGPGQSSLGTGVGDSGSTSPNRSMPSIVRQELAAAPTPARRKGSPLSQRLTERQAVGAGQSAVPIKGGGLLCASLLPSVTLPRQLQGEGRLPGALLFVI